MKSKIGNLFDDVPGVTVRRDAVQLARTEDPETSKASAEDIVEELGALQRDVLSLFQVWGEMTQHRAIERFRQAYGMRAESTIRTRISELVDGGFLADTGQRENVWSSAGKTGKAAIVWGLTERGKSLRKVDTCI